MDKENWKWYGYACHFIGGRKCAYHLGTRVGNYLISTVGDYTPHSSEKSVPIGSGKDDYYETYVFKCDGEDEYGNPNITDLTEVEGIRYADSRDAEKGHMVMCEKYM